MNNENDRLHNAFKYIADCLNQQDNMVLAKSETNEFGDTINYYTIKLSYSSDSNSINEK